MRPPAVPRRSAYAAGVGCDGLGIRSSVLLLAHGPDMAQRLAGDALGVLGEALDELAHVLLPTLVDRVVLQLRDGGLEVVGHRQMDQSLMPAACIAVISSGQTRACSIS